METGDACDGLLIVASCRAVAVCRVGWSGASPPTPTARSSTLYGNVDLRQVELAFNDSERIAAVLVQEGDRVKPGEVWPGSTPAGSKPQVAQAEAQAAAQRQVVERLHNGSRPEEIAQARANVDSAQGRRRQRPAAIRAAQQARTDVSAGAA